ncbi:hypothetical protein GOP47_0009334 [Adiantum capillus-veneris]|uniref:CBM20 domain-containing protein n=1 Tax=Adiantum capillus-veneris TaxID=13818 RepID=A0A9D4UXB5_ADICA|nr:hypothetical protein GOP47_0009334 [Adiantum capillus-veneris]
MLSSNRDSPSQVGQAGSHPPEDSKTALEEAQRDAAESRGLETDKHGKSSDLSISCSSEGIETVTESSSGTQLVKVKFVLEKKCEFGQHFNVVGDDESFGAWNPEASIPMQWSEGHIWTTEMEVFVGKRIEFKVILMGGETVVDWQPGPNRVLETSEASTLPVVLETHWGEDESLQNSGTHYSEIADIESLTEPTTAAKQFSSDSIMNPDGLDLPTTAYDDENEDTPVDGRPAEMLTTAYDKSEDTTIDGCPAEMLSEDTTIDGSPAEMLTTTYDESEDTTVDGSSAEMLTEVSEVLASKNANKDMEKKLTVLEKDLQWGRGALSMLLGVFTRKADNNEP